MRGTLSIFRIKLIHLLLPLCIMFISNDVQAIPVKPVFDLLDNVFGKSARHIPVTAPKVDPPYSELKSARSLSSVPDAKTISHVISYESSHGDFSSGELIANKAAYNLLSFKNKNLDISSVMPSGPLYKSDQEKTVDNLRHGTRAIIESFRVFGGEYVGKKTKDFYQKALNLSSNISETGSSYNRRLFLFFQELYEKSDVYKKYAVDIVSNPEYLFNIDMDNKYLRVFRTGKISSEEKICAKQDFRKFMRLSTGGREYRKWRDDTFDSLSGWYSKEKIGSILKERLNTFAKLFASKVNPKFKEVVNITSRLSISGDYRKLVFEFANVCGEAINLELGNRWDYNREPFVISTSGKPIIAREMNEVLRFGRHKPKPTKKVSTAPQYVFSFGISREVKPISSYNIDHVFLGLCGDKYFQGEYSSQWVCSVITE